MYYACKQRGDILENFVKSPIKWAGGKSKLLDIIIPELNGNTLVEPFLGSGVVSLNSNNHKIIMNDFNEDITNLFLHIKSDANSLLEQMKLLFENGNNKEQYLQNRSLFNLEKYNVKRSALFVYLNRHCFNGLCRYNSKKIFNVPFGKYSTVYFPEKEIRAIHNILTTKSIQFYNQDFEIVMRLAVPGDVIYCDPPYAPLNATSFTNYSGSGFSLEQQIRLAKLAEELSENNIKVIISNNDTEFSREIYKNSDRLLELDVMKSISKSSEGRGKTKEIIAIYQKG